MKYAEVLALVQQFGRVDDPAGQCSCDACGRLVEDAAIVARNILDDSDLTESIYLCAPCDIDAQLEEE